MLKLARVMTRVWAILMTIFAFAFSAGTGNVYLAALTIAGVTTPTAIAAQWLVPIGVIVTLAVGGLMSLFHPAQDVRPIPGTADASGPISSEVASDPQPAQA